MELSCISDEFLSCGAEIVLKLLKRESRVFVNRLSFLTFVNTFLIVRDRGLCLLRREVYERINSNLAGTNCIKSFSLAASCFLSWINKKK